MVWPHHARIVNGNVHIELIEFDILLGECAEQVVKLKSGDSEHRLPIKLGIIKPVEKVNASGTRCSDADAEPARPLRISAGSKCRSLLVPHLYELDLILTLTQCLYNSVDSIAREAKDSIYFP